MLLLLLLLLPLLLSQMIFKLLAGVPFFTVLVEGLVFMQLLVLALVHLGVVLHQQSLGGTGLLAQQALPRFLLVTSMHPHDVEGEVALVGEGL